MLMLGAGRDATRLFIENFHSDRARSLLHKVRVSHQPQLASHIQLSLSLALVSHRKICRQVHAMNCAICVE